MQTLHAQTLQRGHWTIHKPNQPCVFCGAAWRTEFAGAFDGDIAKSREPSLLYVRQAAQLDIDNKGLVKLACGCSQLILRRCELGR